mmetsp:Transcript_92070/g.265711  ORF Transcript_92070/g.265711 Transcript_92070/m.265711 type:complete len:227 (+) Transcript_92070:1265-1945(+)
MMLTEDWMCQDFTFTGVLGLDLGQRVVGRNIRTSNTKSAGEQSREIFPSDPFSHGNTNRLVINDAEVSSSAGSLCLDICRSHTLARNVDSESVEKFTLVDFESFLLQFTCRHACQSMDASTDVQQTFGSVVDRIRSRHVGKKCLGSANVRGSFVTTNMLFASLHCHAKTRLASSVDGDTNDTAWHFARILIGGRQESSMRTTEAHRNSKALCRSNGNISSPGRGRG